MSQKREREKRKEKKDRIEKQFFFGKLYSVRRKKKLPAHPPKRKKSDKKSDSRHEDMYKLLKAGTVWAVREAI